ncbi:glycosyltransferase [Vandammella animalimorsus]|uniref:glycosyltransferase n=1 Tax=Vandammella animalimorsus TaxID=2029117 RepID=UPI0011775D12|nr:glycosyltransferase [Vandammella animalimorsus]
MPDSNAVFAGAQRSAASPSPERECVAVSIVSHGHGQWIEALVRQLQQQAEPCLGRVIVTLNVPEPALQQALQALQAQGALPFTLEIVCNSAPAGFGRNHNAAIATLAACADMPTHICILNPDVQLLDAQPLAQLVAALRAPGTGLAYPRLLDAQGQVQDNERALPSLGNLWRRRVLGRQEQVVDWVSGACMVLRLRDWQRLGGFDEGFHMYCEDVDLSLRVRRDIGALVRAQTRMQHLAQRASRRQLRPLLWHVHSLLRLWRLPSFRWARHHPSAQRRALQ